MLRAGIFIGVLLVSPTAVAAQAPCTTDARRIVDEIYRHMLERAPDPGSGTHVERLANGSATVRDLVRLVAKSPEHTQRFFSHPARRGGSASRRSAPCIGICSAASPIRPACRRSRNCQ